MKNTHLIMEDAWRITERTYSLEQEANVASLFTTGNGYIGVRGSLEEYGSLRIQGAYIRGIIDEIYELPQPFLDNLYMKKYYFDEDKLRRFEKEESVVNFADFLLLRFTVNGETFYPWEGELLSWERTLDMESGRLVRNVRWKNSRGEITRFHFERFSSFDDDHLYALRATVTPENYSGTVEVLSGVDTVTKTNGQLVCRPVGAHISGGRAVWENLSGPAYGFRIATGTQTRLFQEDRELMPEWRQRTEDGLAAVSAEIEVTPESSWAVEKTVYVITQRDTDIPPLEAVSLGLDRWAIAGYPALLERHLAVYRELFSRVDIQIQGDPEADRSVRFSNYHTLLTLARHDHVHSLSAKGLTGETYNNFVWWDCEVYQSPIFFQTMPELAKNILLYRYDKLDQARRNAREEGRPGARFPFTSSVTGKETVWAYARHPFLQIHIMSDIAWGVCHYFLCTGDEAFMVDYGLELLFEIARYWVSRVERIGDRYEIRCVTGTDEHHPYVDNNAYTNYSVCYILKQAAELYQRFAKKLDVLREKIGLSEEEIAAFRDISDALYLPMEKDTGLIPQFDGYFQLDRELEIAGGSAAKSFQMRQSGLYNKSQVIKQPDVLLLFSYWNLRFDPEVYARNWDYYQARCESASSLSYPVHAICAADLSLPDSAYAYLMKTARLDFDDEHGCAWQGIHTACAAGAWLSVVRGVTGVVFHEKGLELHPHMIPWWESVNSAVVWHGQRVHFHLTNPVLRVMADPVNTAGVLLFTATEERVLEPGEVWELSLSLKKRTAFSWC